MVFKRKSPAEQPQPETSQEPVRVGEVIDQTFDISEKKITIDPEAEQKRKLQVVERLVDLTHQVREDEIERAKAGEERDPEEMKALGEQLIELTAKREELSQELGEQPPEEP